MHRRVVFKLNALAPMAAATDSGWNPTVLDAHRDETVIALTDLIIPDTGNPFVRISKPQQISLPMELDAAGNEFFRTAKRLIARIYDNTGIGYREWNKGGRVPRTFGCRA